jgi:hypothetical protein
MESKTVVAVIESPEGIFLENNQKNKKRRHIDVPARSHLQQT